MVKTQNSNNVVPRLTTSSPLVDFEEARPTVPRVGTADHPGSQTDPLPPGEWVDSQVTCHHWHVQVVPAFRLDVHVATEDLQDMVRRGN